MSKEDLRMGQIWVHLETHVEVKIIHLAVAGSGDSVAWQTRQGEPGGGSATEFVKTHACRVMGWSEPQAS